MKDKKINLAKEKISKLASKICLNHKKCRECSLAIIDEHVLCSWIEYNNYINEMENNKMNKIENFKEYMTNKGFNFTEKTDKNLLIIYIPLPNGREYRKYYYTWEIESKPINFPNEEYKRIQKIITYF